MSSPSEITVLAYFRAHDGKVDELKANCEAVTTLGVNEPGSLGSRYSFDGDTALAREDYVSAEAFTTHLENAHEVALRTADIADLTRLEIHGPGAELEKLRGPLAELSPRFFATECGFRGP